MNRIRAFLAAALLVTGLVAVVSAAPTLGQVDDPIGTEPTVPEPDPVAEPADTTVPAPVEPEPAVTEPAEPEPDDVEPAAPEPDAAPPPTAAPAGSEANLPVTDEASYEAAILTASGNGQPDTIQIQNSFTLNTAGAPLFSGVEPLTIEGNGFTVDSSVGLASFLVSIGATTVTIRNLTLDGLDDLSGGAVTVINSDLVVEGSTFSGNSSAGSGGAISIVNGDFTATDSTFTRNEATQSGGAVVVISGSFTATRSTFSLNTGGTTGGGAVAVIGPSTFTATDSTFSGNRTEDLDGGAVQLVAVDATVTRTTFSGNRALSGLAGAILAISSDVVATDAVFTDNHADDGPGGALYNAGGEVTLTRTTVADNTASDTGGGIFQVDGILTANASTFSGNRSATQGGGLFLVSGEMSSTNTTITGNTATNQGGGLYLLNNPSLLTHVTVADNTAPEGANVFLQDTALTSFGTVVALAGAAAQNCALVGATSSTSNGHNHDTDGTCGFGAGPGDVSDGPDPLLGALGDNGGPTETRLPEAASPLIDAIPEADCDPTVTADQRGVARPQDGDDDGTTGCDVGAVEAEFVPPPEPEPPGPPATVPIAATPTFTG